MRIEVAMLAGLIGVAIAATPAARAAEPTAAAAGAPLSGAELYKQRTCVACHGADAIRQPPRYTFQLDVEVVFEAPLRRESAGSGSVPATRVAPRKERYHETTCCLYSH